MGKSGQFTVDLGVIVRFIRCTRPWRMLQTGARDRLYPHRTMMIHLWMTYVAIAQTPKGLGWQAARLWTVTRP